MMFILSEDEYNSLIKKEVHEKVVESLQEVISQDDAIISKLKEEVLHNRPCYQKRSTELRKCVRIPGDGRRTIQTVMRIN